MTDAGTVLSAGASDVWYPTSTAPRLSSDQKLTSLVANQFMSAGIIDAVTPTTTAIESSNLAALAGDPVDLSATVTPGSGPDPDGRVTFAEGGTVLCTGTVTAGSGSCDAGPLPVGTHAIRGVFVSDDAFGSSTSATIDQSVAKIPTEIEGVAGVSTSVAHTPVRIGAEVDDLGSALEATGTANVRRRYDADLHGGHPRRRHRRLHDERSRGRAPLDRRALLR